MTNRDFTLEEILDALLLEEPEPSFEALTRWSDRYPEHTDALARFFAVWAHQTGSDDESAIDEDSLARRGVSYALDLLYRQDTQDRDLPQDLREDDTQRQSSLGADHRVERLSRAAHASGLSVQELANRIDLDESVIQKLDRRRIRGSIPRLCLGRISALINVPVNIVRTMVTGPPILIAGVRHKAKTKPAPVTESFADAIKSSSLPEATQRFWLDAVSTAESEDDEEL